MNTERFFIETGDRYRYDFGLCSCKHGYAQVDTKQDAWYFGTWTNPTTLKTVCYAEGDVTIETAVTETEYVEHIRKLKTWNDENGYGMAIDPGLGPDIRARFTAIGLAELLH